MREIRFGLWARSLASGPRPSLLQAVALLALAVLGGAIAWALMAYYLHGIALALAWAIGAGVAASAAMVMRPSNVLKSAILLLLPMALTLFSVLIGEFLWRVLLLAAELEMPISGALAVGLRNAGRLMAVGDLVMPLLFAAIGASLGCGIVLRRRPGAAERNKQAATLDLLALPRPLQELAGFGPLLKVYRDSPLRQAQHWLGVAALVAVGLGLVYAGGIYFPLAEGKSGGQGVHPALILGAALVMAGVYGIWYVGRRSGRLAALYEDGFVYFDGMRVWRFPWRGFTGLWMKATRHKELGVVVQETRRYAFANAEGEKLWVDGSLVDMEGLVLEIRTRTLPYLQARYRAAHAQGKPLRFGDLTIDPLHGLKIGGKTIPWPEVGPITTLNGKLVVITRSGGLRSHVSIPVANIANLDICLQMLDERRQEAGV